MTIAPKKPFVAILAAFLIAAYLVIYLRGSRERLYAGKPVSLWCDQLPFTDHLPAVLGGGFARMQRSSTNPAEQARLADMEKQALSAINTLGTNCLPQLLSRLRKKRSSVQFESRKLAAKLGVIKQTEVGIWHMRRMSALTGMIELGDTARSIIPELTVLKGDADPWLSAAAAYALNQIAQQESKKTQNEEMAGK